MADISQIKLPDGTTYNLKDSYVRTNYRALSNNDFDTINVTELNAGDLVVTGAARFLNTINGSISGNAATATSANILKDDTTYRDSGTYSPQTDNQTLKVFLTRENNAGVGIGSSIYGGVILSGTWQTGAYNTELWLGMGDHPWLYHRGKNNGTYTNWCPIGKFTQTAPTADQVVVTHGTNGGIKSSGYTIATSVPSGAVFTDTKNTAGSTDTSSKIYLIGATSQSANPQTYSQDTAYVGTDGCLYSGGSKVLTAHQDISGKVSKSGDTMSGALTVEASNSYSSYNEGIRINAGARTYATLLMGGTAGTTSGVNDGAFWLGVYNTGGTARRLMIAHNGSTGTATYFYASSASNVSPSLAIGTDLKVAGVVYASSNNGGTAGGISLYQSSAPTDYGLAMRTTTNSGKHGAVQSDWAVYNYMINSGTNRGWIWKNAASGGGNVASIDCAGNAVFNGYVGIGGNTTNTSGVRQVYNETTKSLDFVFVA